MSDTASRSEFYAPPSKELGLGAACILAREGGQLTFDRVAEVLGDFLQIPEAARNLPHLSQAGYTGWTYHLSWSCTNMRHDGFMARNDVHTQCMCVLTQPGHELGRWAERIYAGEQPELPDWVFAFLKPVFTRMSRLLQGGKCRKPPDYELCRWVRYCYLLNQPALGVALFSLILADNVDDTLYKQTERQARILKLQPTKT